MTIKISPVRGRREYRGRIENFDDDERESGVALALEQIRDLADSSLVVTNDGTGSIQTSLIYGRNPSAGGALALAGGNVEPIYHALSSASPGGKFKADVIGPAVCMLANSIAAITTRGALAWLSTTEPGRVTPTKPATGQAWFVGRFSSTKIGPGRKCQVDLFIFPMSAGGI